jgi:hypothetical protein
MPHLRHVSLGRDDDIDGEAHARQEDARLGDVSARREAQRLREAREPYTRTSSEALRIYS